MGSLVVETALSGMVSRSYFVSTSRGVSAKAKCEWAICAQGGSPFGKAVSLSGPPMFQGYQAGPIDQVLEPFLVFAKNTPGFICLFLRCLFAM